MIRLLLFLLSVPPLLQAQPLFTLDPVAFPLVRSSVADDSVLLDVALMIDRSSLHWAEQGDQVQAAYEVRLRFLSGGQVVLEQVWERTDHAGSMGDVLPGQKIPDAWSLALPAKKLRLEVIVKDLNSTQQTLRRMPLRLKAPGDKPWLSGLRLSLMPPEPMTTPPFILQEHRVVPYADTVFGPTLSDVFTVVQLWLPPDQTDNDALSASLYLLGERQNVLRSSLPKAISSLCLADSRLEDGSRLLLLSFDHDVQDLPTAAYFFEVRLLDGTDVLAHNRHSFFMENPGVEALEFKRHGDEYELYDSAQLSELWSLSSLLATHHELEAWERMDLDARRSFLRQFWERRDTSPNTAMNEARASFLLRVEEARQMFFESGSPGDKTDRGRIYARYGEANHIDTDLQSLTQRFPLEFESQQSNSQYSSSMGGIGSLSGREHNDFQLWRYDYLDGGVEFIFIDVLGFGNYELVHATKSGEFFDPQWVRKLYR
jgi:GWxTD domain-containing protein